MCRSKYVCLLAVVSSCKPKNTVLTQAGQNKLVLSQISDVFCKATLFCFFSSACHDAATVALVFLVSVPSTVCTIIVFSVFLLLSGLIRSQKCTQSHLLGPKSIILSSLNCGATRCIRSQMTYLSCEIMHLSVLRDNFRSTISLFLKSQPLHEVLASNSA